MRDLRKVISFTAGDKDRLREMLNLNIENALLRTHNPRRV